MTGVLEAATEPERVEEPLAPEPVAEADEAADDRTLRPEAEAVADEPALEAALETASVRTSQSS